MKLEAKKRLRLTAGPTYPNLGQLATDLAKTKYRVNTEGSEGKRGVARVTAQAVKEIGSNTAAKAEKFLQEDASSETCALALKGKCPNSFVNSFVRAFCAAFDDLYN